MSTNTNGIATQANLYSLNSSAFPNWNGVLKCPTKAEITAAINSNYTLTIANTNNYGNNQLVKYSDISIAENGVTHTLNVTVHYTEDSLPWPSAYLQFIDGSGKDILLEIIVDSNHVTSSGISSYPLTFSLLKNSTYTVRFTSGEGVHSGVLVWYNHSLGVNGTPFTVDGPTNPVTGTVELTAN